MEYCIRFNAAKREILRDLLKSSRLYNLSNDDRNWHDWGSTYLNAKKQNCFVINRYKKASANAEAFNVVAGAGFEPTTFGL